MKVNNVVYTINFTKSAKKEFLKLPKKTQTNFEEILLLLAKNPYTEILKIKKLKGQEDLFRVRSGDYRLVYFINNKEVVVIVIKIGHRKDVYESFKG